MFLLKGLDCIAKGLKFGVALGELLFKFKDARALEPKFGFDKLACLAPLRNCQGKKTNYRG